MKYMGSKQRIAKELLSIILANDDGSRPYVEPFVGGFNMICEVPSRKGGRFANDINHYVVALFNAVINGWEPPANISKEVYQDIKSDKDQYPPELVGYVGFCCSYSGKWFGGYAGKTNTKIGTVRDYQDESLRNIKKQAAKLADIHLCSMEYDKLVLPNNSIVYCDPPYSETTGYKDDFDSEKFWHWVRIISIQGHKVFVSEYKAPKDFICIWEKKLTSSLSANGKIGGNKVSTERLFTLCS